VFQDRLFGLFPDSNGTRGIPLGDAPPAVASGAPVLPPVLPAVVQSVGAKPAEPEGSGQAAAGGPGSLPVPPSGRHAAAARPRVRPGLPGSSRARGREGRNQNRRLAIAELGEQMRARVTGGDELEAPFYPTTTRGGLLSNLQPLKVYDSSRESQHW